MRGLSWLPTLYVVALSSVVIISACGDGHAAAAGELFPGTKSVWRGYERYEGTVNGRGITIVVPKRVAAGKPWIWRARFFDHRPEVDLALLGEGFHMVCTDDPQEMLGSPEAVGHGNAVYKYLVERHGFARKPALEGLSRGGLYVYNWAAANPDKVACIYADAPVCDFKSWPGGRGKGRHEPGVWAAMCKSYGFKNDQEALAYDKNPIDNLKSLAAARIPLLHVYGDADTLVPHEENTAIIKERYEAMGGEMVAIAKKGIGHEHGLADPSPIIRFILKHATTPEALQPVLKGVRRVVVLGDSITYSGQYVEYLEAFLLTRFPDRRFELINLGLPSENVSGLTEEGHAGGAFPRPDLHERLGRVLAKSKPDLVVACYGINDGIYMPFSEERLARYQNGMRRLVKQVRAAGADIVLMTPPPFDPQPLAGKTSATGQGAPYQDYDRVMDRYSQWLVDRAAEGWRVVDVHSAMNQHVAIRRARTSEFILAGDGVHTNAFGHWLMAQQLLLAWGVPAEVDGAVIELGMLRVSRGHVTDLVVEQGVVRFSWRTLQPMPMDPQWDPESIKVERIAERLNRHQLVVAGLPAGRYQLFEGETLIDTLDREELGRGVEVNRLAKLSVNQRGAELLKLIRQRQSLIKDAWLTDVGHTRPGMAKGEPLKQATEQAEKLETRIRQTAGPVTMSLRLVPVGR